jgi:hypothetical protein
MTELKTNLNEENGVLRQSCVKILDHDKVLTMFVNSIEKKPP